MADNFNKSISKISAGRTVAFFGAGFSHNATKKGKPLPLARALANELAKSIDEDPDTDLDVIADIFKDKDQESKLFNILKSAFETDYIPEYMEYLITLPWKRIYTTNYDSIIDDVFNNKSIKFESYDRKNKPESISKENISVIYLNGELKNCTERTLFDNIHITNTVF